jgi:hypothetical protein
VHIVSFREPLYSQFAKSSGRHEVAFEPHKPYVVSNSQFSRMMEEPRNKAMVYRTSSLESRVTPFNVHAASQTQSSPLMFWTGAGGFGDQIMAWPVTHILHRMGFQVHAMVDPGHLTCWWGFPWIKSVFQFPTYLEHVMLYKHHVLFEMVTNADEHPDQLHPVDSMLLRLGIDPDAVSPDLKVIRPAFTAGELARAKSETGGRKIGIYQLAAAGKTRTLSPEQSVSHLVSLANAHLDIFWIALFDTFVDPAHRIKAESSGCPNVRSMFFQNLRDLWALVSQASVVVSPDSMMIHVAGSMNIPCVGLWGSIDPKVRTKYYKNHVALWKQEKCAACPCFQHYNVFPDYCPSKESDTCQVLAEISSSEISNAVGVLLG